MSGWSSACQRWRGRATAATTVTSAHLHSSWKGLPTYPDKPGITGPWRASQCGQKYWDSRPLTMGKCKKIWSRLPLFLEERHFFCHGEGHGSYTHASSPICSICSTVRHILMLPDNFKKISKEAATALTGVTAKTGSQKGERFPFTGTQQFWKERKKKTRWMT